MTAGQSGGARSESVGPLARIGAALADWSERWFPDAYVFAAIAVVIVCVAALFMGRTPMQVGTDFGKSFWTLIPFTMQMSFVVIGGYVLAVAPPVKRLVVALARVPQTPRGAVAYVAFVAMGSSLLSWGFSLIFAGIVSREVSKRIKGVDYRAVGTAAYLGLGSVWALGLSSSAALLMCTKGSIPPALYKISGVIPLTETLFTWQNLVMIVVLMALSVWVAYASCPGADRAKTIEMAGLSYAEEEAVKVEKPKRPGEWLEFSPILTLVIVVLGVIYLYDLFRTRACWRRSISTTTTSPFSSPECCCIGRPDPTCARRAKRFR